MSNFLTEIKTKAKQVREYLLNSPFQKSLAPDYIREGTLLYTARGGKMLRPAILMLACEAMGGDAQIALPAAAAVEMSHTWTLVHDDIIDNDDLRRSGPSVHAHFRDRFKDLLTNQDEREEFARSQAILVGDLQQAWATSLINELGEKIDGRLFRFLLRDLTVNWAPRVLAGEALDVEYAKRPLKEVSEEMILDMLSEKTASTFAFAGRAGALIGLNKLDPEHSLVTTIEEACMNAGLAFQLRDDVLGIIGDEEQLGKPVGSDIREGKRTTIIAHAYRQADSSQKDLLNSILGKPDASRAEVIQVRQLVTDLGSIEHTEKLAGKYASRARKLLGKLPDSQAKLLLDEWIDFIIERMF